MGELGKRANSRKRVLERYLSFVLIASVKQSIIVCISDDRSINKRSEYWLSVKIALGFIPFLQMLS